MGTTNVLIIGARPLAQLYPFREPHDMNGGDIWYFCVCTFDRLVLKPGAVGSVFNGNTFDDRGEVFIEIAGGLAGQARQDAIDFDAMRDAAGAEAAARWDRARAACAGWTWDTLHQMYQRDPGDPAYAARHQAQPAVRAMREAGFYTGGWHADQYALPRQDVVDAARASALAGPYFQVVHDGELLADNSEDAQMREMNEDSQPASEYLARSHAYFARIQSILDAAPGKTLLTSATVKC